MAKNSSVITLAQKQGQKRPEGMKFSLKGKAKARRWDWDWDWEVNEMTETRHCIPISIGTGFVAKQIVTCSAHIPLQAWHHAGEMYHALAFLVIPSSEPPFLRIELRCSTSGHIDSLKARIFRKIDEQPVVTHGIAVFDVSEGWFSFELAPRTTDILPDTIPIKNW